MLRETASQKRILLWNAAGSAVYALSSFLLLIIVVRICGEEEGGVFSIGYAIAQLMLTIGVFESTTFFATDARRAFSYEQFFAFRLVTCALMVLASIVYVLSFGYDAHKAAVAYALCGFRLFEAAAQFWYASFQREERLDVGGFSSVWRCVLSMAAFAAVLAPTKNIVAAMVAATLVELGWILAYDHPRLNRIVRMGRPDFSPQPLRRLFVACLPLFIGSFLATYLGNVCKYAIDAVGTDAMQTVFNVLFMPSFVINLFMIFFMRPTLTKLARLWLNRETRAFGMVVGKLLLLAVGITAVVMLGCAIAGIPLLELLYGIRLEGQLPALLALMLGGGLLSASNVFYNTLVVIRAQSSILVGYVLAIAVATAVATPLVQGYGIFGATIAYAVACGTLFVSLALAFGLCAHWKLRNRQED